VVATGVDLAPFRHLYPFESHWLTVQGHRYHYVDEGAGDPIILVHGNPTWSFLYREFITEFSPGHRVIAPDHLGFGLSDKPVRETTYSLDYHITNLEALVTQLDLKNVTLVVHDWGGPIGLGMAARHPDRIKSIVVMNSFGLFPPSEKMDPDNIELPIALRLLRTKTVGTFMARTLGMFERVIMATTTANKKRLRTVKAARTKIFRGPKDRGGVAEFPRMIPANSRHPSAQVMINEISPFLKSFEKPMRIFWSKKDPFMAPEILTGWQQAAPHAEVTTIENASHYIQEDAFETVIPQMKTFIDRT
jgi:pimeloyl-ACP methyl ester carboxylesterase